MTETNNTPEPAHDCAEEIAKAMWKEYSKRQKVNILIWSDLTAEQRNGWRAVAKAVPGIIINHAGDDLKAWMAAKIGTSSPWRSLLGYISSAAVGAAVLWAASFFASCSPMTSEQVRQIDAAHAIMHRVTGTDCTLCAPVAVTPNGK